MIISDEMAKNARLTLLAWFIQRGASVSTHFADPTGEPECFPDPLGFVLTRGPAALSLHRWAESEKRGREVIPGSATLSPLRWVDEIQRAHDLLWAIRCEEPVRSRLKVGEEELKLITAALDVLCWVLRHDHNSTFADNVRNLEAEIEAAGLRIEPIPEGRS